MMPTDKSVSSPDISFFRLMACVLFLPCFLLMENGLAIRVYYVAGAFLLYAFILYLSPKITSFLNSVVPITIFIDFFLITLFIIYNPGLTLTLSSFYLLPIIAVAFIHRLLISLLTVLLASGQFVLLALSQKISLNTIIIQVMIFLIFSFFIHFLSLHFRQAYYKQANQDTLTKISNRRYFNHVITQLTQTQTPFTLIFIDLDNFKNLNDNLGHYHGDYVLKIIAGIIRDCIRSADFAARIGGDEFAVILPKTPKAESKNIAERIRNNVIVSPKLLDYPQVSISQGIAAFPEDASSLAEIQDKADKALYIAKSMGKNYVHLC